MPVQPWGDKWSLPYRQIMENAQNTQYSAELNIGPTKIRGIFDTGSFELLVLSARCEHCHVQPYDHTKSTTFHENGTIVQHVFGSGPCLSMKGYEQITVGPMSSDHMTFYEIVDHNIPVFEQASFTAIVGLGDGPNEEDRSLLQHFGVNEFSICLERGSGAPGWLTWGGELSPAQREKAVSLNVVGEHHWAVVMTNLGAVGQPVTCADGCGAILDSGTSLIAAPTEALVALGNILPPIAENCSNLDDLPDLEFTLDGHTLTLPPEAYVLKVQGTTVEADNVWDILYFKPKVKKLDECVPAFMQIDRNTQFGPLWILGMPFFRYFHSTFSMAKDNRTDRHVLLAGAADDCKPEDLPQQKVAEPVAAAQTEAEKSTVEKSKVALAAAGVRVVYGSRRGKQNPVEVDLKTLLPPMLGEGKTIHL